MTVEIPTPDPPLTRPATASPSLPGGSLLVSALAQYSMSADNLIHSVETTAANVHDLTPASELLHGEESVMYADAGYQGIEKRSEMQGRGIGFRVAMRPGKRRALPDTPEGRVDDLIETAKAHIRAKVEHPFRVIKRQFGFQKTRLRGMLKNRCKVNVLAALSNLFMVRHELLCRS